MGVAERRARERQQRIDSIVDAAETVIFANGLSSATMDQIADTAEVSKGTLYLYFTSKQELYQAICSRGLERLCESFKSARGESLSGLEEIQRVGRYYLDFSREFPDYHRSITFFEAHPNRSGNDGNSLDDRNRIMVSILKLITRSVEKGQNDGSIRRDYTPADLGVLFWAQSTGVIQLITMNRESGLFPAAGANGNRLNDLYLELIQQAFR